MLDPRSGERVVRTSVREDAYARVAADRVVLQDGNTLKVLRSDWVPIGSSTEVPAQNGIHAAVSSDRPSVLAD